MNTQHFPYKYAMFLSRLTHICIYNATLFLLGHQQKITACLQLLSSINLNSCGKTLSASKDIGR